MGWNCNTVSILKTGAKMEKNLFSKIKFKESYLNEWQSFVNFKSKKPEITIEEAMITLKTIQFAIKSNKLNGKMIRYAIMNTYAFILPEEDPRALKIKTLKFLW